MNSSRIIALNLYQDLVNWPIDSYPEIKKGLGRESLICFSISVGRTLDGDLPKYISIFKHELFFYNVGTWKQTNLNWGSVFKDAEEIKYELENEDKLN